MHIEYLTEFHGSQGGDCQFHNLNTIFHIKAKKYIKDGMFSLCPVKQLAQPHPLFFFNQVFRRQPVAMKMFVENLAFEKIRRRFMLCACANES